MFITYFCTFILICWFNIFQNIPWNCVYCSKFCISGATISRITLSHGASWLLNSYNWILFNSLSSDIISFSFKPGMYPPKTP